MCFIMWSLFLGVTLHSPGVQPVTYHVCIEQLKATAMEMTTLGTDRKLILLASPPALSCKIATSTVHVKVQAPK